MHAHNQDLVNDSQRFGFAALTGGQTISVYCDDLKTVEPNSDRREPARTSVGPLSRSANMLRGGLGLMVIIAKGTMVGVAPQND